MHKRITLLCGARAFSLNRFNQTPDTFYKFDQCCTQS